MPLDPSRAVLTANFQLCGRKPNALASRFFSTICRRLINREALHFRLGIMICMNEVERRRSSDQREGNQQIRLKTHTPRHPISP